MASEHFKSRDSMRVLVCDDDPALLDLMHRRLEKLGLTVDRASAGAEASARLSQHDYDLLVTDIYMPEITGLDLLRQFKAKDPTGQVVVATASATLESAIEAMNHGAFAYLTKPFDHISVFDNVVSRAVDFRRALLDNLRMGEVQRRRGDLLEEEIAGRIRQVKRIQEYLIDLLACLPVGVVVLDGEGRVELANPRAEALFGSRLVGGQATWRPVLDQLPEDDHGQRQGEVEVEGRRLEVSLTRLDRQADSEQRVVVAREPDEHGPAMGSLVHESVHNLRRGLTWLAGRDDDADAKKILRGMAQEVASLASLLGVRLAKDSTAEDRSGTLPPPPAGQSAGVQALAPAVIPPRREAGGGQARRETSAPPMEPLTVEAALPRSSKSLLLRKGMTMVLEGRLHKKSQTAELAARPEDAQRMKEQIERWARSGEEPAEGTPEEPSPGGQAAWPPPLPSSAAKP
jgi:CheY-like chemotaxis protein